jgi:hypothetical protein
MWTRRARIGTTVGSVLIALTLVGCSLGSSNATGSGDPEPVAISPSASAIDSPSPAASPAPSPTPSATHEASAKPTASVPPPPPPKPGQCPRTPQTVGKSQSAKTILADLKHAATVDEYEVTKPVPGDSRLHGKEPIVHIPLTMLKAVAAQESGWTSNCISRDGSDAYGTMQMQSLTADSANSKLHTGFNRLDPEQNILVANEWLEYLTVHFGLEYFDSDFNLASKHTRLGDTEGGTIRVTLADAVLAAYNTGLGIVDRGLNGKMKIYIGPIGLGYAQSVQALMSPPQACQKSWGR